MYMNKLVRIVLLLSLIVSSVSCVNNKERQEQVKNADMALDNETFNSLLHLMHEPMAAKPFQKTKNPDIDFIVNMIPHHEGAIASSEIFIQIATDEEVKRFAQLIIDLQTSEIIELDNLNEYLHQNPKDYSDIDYISIGDKSEYIMSKTMSNMMNANFVNNLDIDYLLAMIAHHQGAVESSQVILGASKDDKVKAIANNIISSQKDEISQMITMINRLKTTPKQSEE